VERSETIGELAKALVKAQAAMRPVKKDLENPFFKSKYADLAAVWENCRKPLTENGLSVVQIPESEDGSVIIKTVLLHESGEWISGQLQLTLAKSDPQAVGSAITYGRRYALAAMTGMCAEDEDDDGQKSSTPDNNETTPANNKTRQPSQLSQQKTHKQGQSREKTQSNYINWAMFWSRAKGLPAKRGLGLTDEQIRTHAKDFFQTEFNSLNEVVKSQQDLDDLLAYIEEAVVLEKAAAQEVVNSAGAS